MQTTVRRIALHRARLGVVAAGTCGALALALVPAGTARADASGPRGLTLPRHTGVQSLAAAGLTGPNLLSYAGGPVMRTNTVHTLFWVPAGFSVSANYVSLINGYFQNAAAANGALSNVYATTPQYTDTVGGGSHPAAYATMFGGTFTDTTAFPSSGCTDTWSSTTVCLSDAQIRLEIALVSSAQGWSHGTGDMVFVFTPSNVGSCVGTLCAYSDFCGYHDYYGAHSNPTVYAVQPYAVFAQSPSACNTGISPNADDADATINIASHEHLEAITDPLQDSWYVDAAGSADDGEENGDKCQWTFGSAVGGSGGSRYNQVINGAHYWLQQEWSNADAACVQTMALPASTATPAVSGTPQNGLSLSATQGAWTTRSTPAFAYQWRRCDGAGASCVAISGATSATYTAVSADVGSTIVARVTATTGVDTVAADSAATAAVTQMAAPSNTAVPTINGTAQGGQTLTVASPGTWTSIVTPTFAYQWKRCSPACVSISGATTSSYTLDGSDVGQTVRVDVVASNAGGSTAATSAATAPVLAAAGGGGGGGGSSEPPPNLLLSASATPIPRNVGDAFSIIVSLVNKGGGSFNSTVTLALSPGLSYFGSQVTRGQGCVSTDAQTVRCDLDFFPASYVDTVRIDLKVTAFSNLTATATVVSAPSDIDPKDDTVAFSFPLLGSTSTQPVTTFTSPARTVATATAADVKRPTVNALASTLTRGKHGVLRYTLNDNSRRAGATVRVLRGTTVIATLESAVHAVEAREVYTLAWKPAASLKPGKLSFCVVGSDRAGNSSAPDCASLTLR